MWSFIWSWLSSFSPSSWSICPQGTNSGFSAWDPSISCLTLFGSWVQPRWSDFHFHLKVYVNFFLFHLFCFWRTCLSRSYLSSFLSCAPFSTRTSLYHLLLKSFLFTSLSCPESTDSHSVPSRIFNYLKKKNFSNKNSIFFTCLPPWIWLSISTTPKATILK